LTGQRLHAFTKDTNSYQVASTKAQRTTDTVMKTVLTQNPLLVSTSFALEQTQLRRIVLRLFVSHTDVTHRYFHSACWAVCLYTKRLSLK